MITIQELKKSYDDSLHVYERGIFREYLQYKILEIVFKHQYGMKLSFLGGTALRIAYKLSRFSEDLDFDNKGLSFQEFEKIAQFIQKELSKEGFEVEMRSIKKGAYHCYVKFPELLYKSGLSPLKGEKIMIKTFDQGVDYERKEFFLDKFDIFSRIIVTPKSVILSQKLWTITQRKTPKGRDFYDIMFLLQHTRPDPDFLNAKFGTDDLAEIKDIVLNSCQSLNFDLLIKDLAPFLLKPQDAEKIKLFEQFVEQKL